jgi:hypothetical protein
MVPKPCGSEVIDLALGWFDARFDDAQKALF